MTTTTIARMFLVFCLTALSATPPARAQATDDISVSADVAARRVYVGDRVTYQLKVSGTSSPGTPELDLPPGVTARYVSGHEQSSTFTSIVNGRRTTRGSLAYVIQYELVIHEPGFLTIGPAAVEVEGDTYTSNRVQLQALQPDDAEGFALDIELVRDTLYVGEVARIRVSWYLGGDARAPSFDATRIPPGFEVLPSRTPPGAGEYFRFEMLGQPIVGVLDDAVRDDERYRRLRFDLLLTPTREGVYTLGPVSVVFDRVTPGVGRTRSVSESGVLEVEVVEPPAEGRPPGYDGLIGRFDIGASIPVDTVNVGDPIELTVRITGDEPMPGVTDGPPIDAQPAFADRFRLDPDGWEEVSTTRPGMRIFRTTIRALSADIEQIPPVELAHFDVDLGVYRVAASDAIPLTVRAVREITADDAVLGPAAPRVVSSPLTDADAGLWAPDAPEDIWRAGGFDLVEIARSPAWIGAVAGPPGVFAALALVVGVRKRGVGPSRLRRRALKAALSELRSSGPARGARRLVAELLGREPGSVTAADCAAFGLDDDTAGQLRRLLESDEATRFGAAPPEATAQQRAKNLLRAVCRTAEVPA